MEKRANKVKLVKKDRLDHKELQVTFTLISTMQLSNLFLFFRFGRT